MNKTINANIGGFVFQVDEDAYQVLHNYIETLKRHFTQSEGRDEIIEDIESRIAELLLERLQTRTIVNLQDVEAIIAAMGKPEDFDDSNEQHTTGTFSNGGEKRFFRNPDDKILGGVCSGISAYFGIDPLWLRLGFILSIFGFGTGFLIYIILWIIIPEAKTAAEKLQMRGEKVNISNIEKTIKEEFEQVKNRFNEFTDNTKNYAKSDGAREFRSGTQKFFHDLGNFFRNVFQYLGKALGIFVVVIGIIILVSLGLGAVGTTSAISFQYPGFMDYIFENQQQVTLATIGLVLLIAIPVIALITKGLLFLMKVKVKSPLLRISLGTTWVIGLLITIYACWRVGMDFRTKGTYVETTVIQVPGDTLWLNLKNDQHLEFIDFNDDDFDGWHFDQATIYEDTIIMTDIELRIDLVDRPDVEMRIYFTARGSNRYEANQRARKLQYEFETDTNSISFNPTFSIAEKLWRNQRVRINLRVPKSKTVQMSNELDRFLYIDEYDFADHHAYQTVASPPEPNAEE